MSTGLLPKNHRSFWLHGRPSGLRNFHGHALLQKESRPWYFYDMNSANRTLLITRRQAVKSTGKALVGVVGVAGLSQFTAVGVAQEAKAPPQTPGQGKDPSEKFRVATCQFPVSGDPVENAKFIRDF